MSIQNIVKAKIEKDLEELELYYQKELKLISENFELKTKNLERKYNSEISNVIDSELNMHKFLNKRDSKFKNESNFNKSLDKIYSDMIIEIIESKFGKNILNKFVKDLDKNSEFIVKGKLSDKLISELKALGYSNFEKHQDESILGIVLYQEEDRYLEFDLEDIIENVKKLTLNKVIESL